MALPQKLIQKYNVPGPRYTSYPTVPFWNKEAFKASFWYDSISRSFNESNTKEGISLYIHLPFCESMCSFCACHKRITIRHSVEEPYITTLLKEWRLYLDIWGTKPKIQEIHLGGGTPTFFSPSNLKRLIEGILSKADIAENYRFSFEGHPNNTTKEHLQTLFDLGFKRVSFGVQDYDLRVQEAINRIQPAENIERVTKQAREIGYLSVGHDLIFGLPFQTETSIRNTIDYTIQYKPERIAYYSYAHVPWIRGVGQRKFKDEDLPKDEEKRHLYELGKNLLFENGYHEIGMDHFALPEDDLYIAMQDNSLHRNFMGYTAGKTQLMVGLGVSSISDSWYGFAQNEKQLEQYEALVNKGVLPVHCGHILTKEDLCIRKHILNIMCRLRTNWSTEDTKIERLEEILKRLEEMVQDGLLNISDTGLTVNESGRMFIRNICMAFDLRLLERQPQTSIFSMTI